MTKGIKQFYTREEIKTRKKLFIDMYYQSKTIDEIAEKLKMPRSRIVHLITINNMAYTRRYPNDWSPPDGYTPLGEDEFEIEYYHRLLDLFIKEEEDDENQ